MSGSDIDRYLNRRDKGQLREIVTPEGVPLRMTLALAGDRAGAFALDVAILFATLFAVILLAAFAFGVSASSDSSLAATMVIVFLLRNFYFTFFELRWQGVTPGKRILGLRVIDRRGGPLTADAVVARNLMREVEVFIPASVLASAGMLWPNAHGGVRVVAVIWVLIIMLLPLFNKDRLRVGDMVAGTLVVLTPKTLLMADLGGVALGAGQQQQQPQAYAFTPEQLGVYGIYELQVLENLLREETPGYEHYEALEKVCERVKLKIDWPRSAWRVESERFLREFYAALRLHLEKDLLFGKRKEDKFSSR